MDEHLSTPRLSFGELVEVYGEDTAYVSQNDIDRLREELSQEEFAELCLRLGWQNLEGSNDAA